jgi:MFS family permease
VALSFLDREHTVAKPGYSRWLIPPAALAIHLCIGQAYATSVYKNALVAHFESSLTAIGVIFSIAIVMLGLSAAVMGTWVERAGPRAAMFTSACFWASGFLIGALGIATSQLWLVYLGYGFVGGIGLGIGYISPVSTLIKWFPDRPGLATGMAIMGFGGGAMIGSPLADRLMRTFATSTSVGVWETFVTMGIIYTVAMLAGAFGYRVPPESWRPAGWAPPPQKSGMITSGNVHVSAAWRTPQFWFLWGVLCLNVSAGIGVIGIASPMIQEVFGGQLLGRPGVALRDLDAAAKAELATIGAAFAALLSVFNIVGRISWASLSDYIGRQRTYLVFFTLGAVLYAAAPWAARIHSVALFVILFCLILTMYGGGFATIPAYLADIFGTKFVGAIHGRLLTAWSAAGVLGPVLVNYIREAQLERGVPAAQAYNVTMYILAALLVVGFVCNLAVRPVHERYYMKETETDGRAPSPVVARS